VQGGIAHLATAARHRRKFHAWVCAELPGCLPTGFVILDCLTPVCPFPRSALLHPPLLLRECLSAPLCLLCLLGHLLRSTLYLRCSLLHFQLVHYHLLLCGLSLYLRLRACLQQLLPLCLNDPLLLFQPSLLLLHPLLVLQLLLLVLLSLLLQLLGLILLPRLLVSHSLCLLLHLLLILVLSCRILLLFLRPLLSDGWIHHAPPLLLDLLYHTVRSSVP
jgi:hypothetical protein